MARPSQMLDQGGITIRDWFSDKLQSRRARCLTEKEDERERSWYGEGEKSAVYSEDEFFAVSCMTRVVKHKQECDIPYRFCQNWLLSVIRCLNEVL